MTEREFKDKVLTLSKVVFPMARRMLKDNDMARDAVQHSMMKLWENRKQLDKCTNIKAFTYTVVRNVCIDEMKRKKPVIFDDIPQSIKDKPVLNDHHEKKEIIEIIQEIIEELPKNQKEVIQMRDIDGLEFEEIAGVLETDIAYIRVLLSRARKTVKEKIEKIYAYEAIGRR
jgi:RNA polymerase sigma-70 factor (ECF subfamily)